jgi:NDP-sugar pyrophosphorylase family protein
MYEFATRKNATLTVGVKRHVTPFAFGNLYFEGEHVVGIEEKQDIVRFILGGIYVMRPEILDLIPRKQAYGMDHLIKAMLAKSIAIVKYEIDEYWLDIGQISDYESSTEIYERYFRQDD